MLYNINDDINDRNKASKRPTEMVSGMLNGMAILLRYLELHKVTTYAVELNNTELNSDGAVA